VVLQC